MGMVASRDGEEGLMSLIENLGMVSHPYCDLL